MARQQPLAVTQSQGRRDRLRAAVAARIAGAPLPAATAASRPAEPAGAATAWHHAEGERG
jgi:hypothetical protein